MSNEQLEQKIIYHSNNEQMGRFFKWCYALGVGTVQVASIQMGHFSTSEVVSEGNLPTYAVMGAVSSLMIGFAAYEASEGRKKDQYIDELINSD